MLTKEQKQLKTALVQWAYSTGSVYMTDAHTGPEGIIACDEAVCVIKEPAEDGTTVIHFRGDEELKELLQYIIRDIPGVKLV